MRKRANWKVVWVAAKDLRVHPDAQRDVNPAKLKRLIAEFDLDKIGVVYAVECEINGVFGIWLIDGQHRVKALLAHDMGEWEIQVAILPGVVDVRRASDMFLGLNDRIPIPSLEKFKNEVQAGREVSVGVMAVLTSRRLTLGKKGNGQVLCVDAMKSVYQRDRGKTLGLALDTLLAAYGRTVGALEGPLVAGVALIHATYGDNVDRDALIRKMAKTAAGAAGLLGKARALREMSGQRKTVAHCVAEYIVNIYNAGRRTRTLEALK